MSRFSSARAELAALVLLVLVPGPAAASWPYDPAINVPLCVATGAQRYPEAAPDIGGGAIVAWDDQRGGPRDIYAQRVDRTGTARWTGGGVVVCSATNEQYEPKIIPDGSGGAIMTWSDYRNGVAYDIYAQRIDSTGTPKWTGDGVVICNAGDFQEHPAILPDGSGGAIITWDDDRTGTGANRIYAQRVNASGLPQWTANGVVLTTSLSGQARPLIVTNGADGAIVAWEDYRNGNIDIFAQRVLSNGTVDPAWPALGRGVVVTGGDEEDLAMASDGNGGAYIGWAHLAGGLTRDVYVKHVLSTGTIDPAWPANGRAMVVDSYDQGSTVLLADGSGGVIVGYDDLHSSRDIYAQHVLSTGALDPAWPSAGVGLCLHAGDQMYPRMVKDGAGGAIVTWWDNRNDDGDLYAQHVSSTGAVDPAWPTDGRALCTAAGLQVLPSIVSDGSGGAVVAWQDRRANAGPFGEDEDIYAQGVRADGQLGDVPVGVSGEPQVGFALEPPNPNPMHVGAMIVRFTLPTAAAASLELLDIAGRRVIAREVGSLGAGHHAIDLAAGRGQGSGIYFVRLRQADAARVQRIVVLDR